MFLAFFGISGLISNIIYLSLKSFIRYVDEPAECKNVGQVKPRDHFFMGPLYFVIYMR